MAKNLKFSLQVLLVYFLLVFFGSILAGFANMIYTLCTTLVAGSGLASFNFILFLRGILVTGPSVLGLSVIFVSFYMIRHRITSVIPSIVFCLTYIATWVFLVPPFLKAGENNSWRFREQIERQNLSEGYFRENGDYIFFYSAVSKDGLSDGICIKTQGAGKGFHTFSNTLLPSKTHTFTDSIIEKTVEFPMSVKFLIGLCLKFRTRMEECKHSFIDWLALCSVSLALLGVIFLRHISSWRLVDAFLITACATIVLFVNAEFSPAGFLYGKPAFLSDMLSFIPEKCCPVLLFLNVLTFIIFTVFGIIARERNMRKGNFSHADDI